MAELTCATLRLREQGNTWHVQLHRPDAGNAINETMVSELTEVLCRASSSPATVVVLEGLPEVFCSGADFAVIGEAARAGGRTAADPQPLLELFRQLAYGDFVSVAHVRGKANAGGLGLVAASDVVIADHTASFSLSELLFGLIPAVVLPFLIRRTGFQHANYLAASTLTADPAQACEWGLVDVWGQDSELLLRKHLQRLERLSKKAVVRYKSYLRQLHPITDQASEAALATNRLVFGDPENIQAIRRYTEDGLFPWEAPPANEAFAPPAPTSPSAPAAPTSPAAPPAPTSLPAPAGVARQFKVPPEALGNPRFRETHGLRFNYAAGAMYKGIASVELVTAMGRAGLLAFFGTGGLGLAAIEDALVRIGQQLDQGQAYGVNLLSNPQEPDLELGMVELYLKHGVRTVEASGYIYPSAALVRYRLAGLSRDSAGRIRQDNHLIAKVSRAEVAQRFVRPAPAELVRQLVERGLVTPEQATLSERLPLAQDLCAEADSAGHTDGGNAYVLMPAMRSLLDRVAAEQRYDEPLRLGAAGGIGTAEAALAAFTLGADFIVTGSINQCTVEAGTSDAVKDILQELGVHDTDYAPAGDMFEVGAKVQAVRKGLFFPVRAKKLYELYLSHDSIEDLDAKTRNLLEEKFFRRSIEAVWQESRARVAQRFPEQLAEIEGSPKRKMALIFRWYFVHSTRLAMSGSSEQRVDYQIHCGPAMGAFNSWVKGTPLETWRGRHVDAVAEHLLTETAALLSQRLEKYGSYS